MYLLTLHVEWDTLLIIITIVKLQLQIFYYNVKMVVISECILLHSEYRW